MQMLTGCYSPSLRFLAQDYSDGRLIVPGVVMLLLTAGILKLASILRRPQVNRLCVLALLIVLGGWLVMTIAETMRNLLGMPVLVSGLAGLTGAGALLVSLVMAIIGLAQERSRPGEYVQGKRQGITAVILSILLLGAFGAGLWIGITNKYRAGPLGAGAAADGGENPGISGTEEFKELNFKIGRLERPWVRLPKGKILADAQALYSCAMPEMYMSVIAEANTINLARGDMEALMEARVKSRAAIVEVITRETLKLGGIEFLRITSKVSGVPGVPVPLCYDQWVACNSRHIYQFTCWTPFDLQSRLRSATRTWLESFALLEPISEVEESANFKDVENPGEGYATRLAEEGWKPAGSDAFPEGDIVARKGVEMLSLMVLPLPDTAGLRDQELEDRMLETLARSIQRDRLKGPKEIIHSGMSGHEYSLDDDPENQLCQFRARILRQDGIAWMLLSWATENLKGNLNEKAVDSVRLSGPSAGATPATPPPAVSRNRALMLNDLGIKLYGRQEYSRAEAFFQEARRLAPGDAPILGNLLDAMTHQNRWKEALEILTRPSSGEALVSTPSIKARQAQILTSLEDHDGAATTWAELFKAGYVNDDHLLQWVNLELMREQPQAALKAVRDYAAAHPSSKLTRWEAGVLGRMDQYGEALKLLAPLVEGGKPDPEALYLKGELENDAGRYEDAEKSATRLVAAGEDTPRTRMILGWSEWHRKSWKAARSAFEKAAEKAPNDPAIREAVSMTNGALGQGTAEISGTPIEPVAVPEAVRKAVASHPAPPESLVKGHGAVQQQRFSGYYFEPGKPAKSTHYYKVKVQDTSGVEAFSTLSLKFYPASERVYVNKLSVRDENGATVQEGASTDAYTSGEDGDIASGAQILRVPVPGLRRGCTLEAAITVEDKSKSTKPPLRRDLFVGTFPTLARGSFFTGDTQALKILTSPGLTAAGPHAWIAFDLPAFRREELSASLEEWMPWVLAGSSGSDWKTPALNYLKRLGDRLKPDASTEKITAQLSKGLSTPQEKLEAMVHYVQSTLTYKGLEFGTRALIPSAVDKIQSDHYGDCKDHTTLLYHLLRRAGIKCHPALVNTAWKIHQGIPSLDQFDHMILYVPGVAANPWIDATDDGLNLVKFVPSSLVDSQALVLDPDNPRFEKIPAAASTQVRIDRRVGLQAGNRLQVEETLTLDGEYASWGRSWFLNAPGSEHPSLVRRQWDGYGDVEIPEVTLTNADNPDKPLIVQLKYTVGDAVDSTGQVILPFFWERDYLSVNPMDDRRSPFALNPTLELESRTRLQDPLLSHPPAGLPAEGKTIGGEWRLSQDSSTKEAVILLTVKAPAGNYPAAHWPEFQQGRRVLTDKLKRSLLTLPTSVTGGNAKTGN
ncbi:MAG: hypothetical protein JWM59_4332 [Verrucomicrobiales bacterium]|nr:hypothetical protein [Verrucomicrobiales bacterium]